MAALPSAASSWRLSDATTVRAVTHLDVSAAGVDAALGAVLAGRPGDHPVRGGAQPPRQVGRPAAQALRRLTRLDEDEIQRTMAAATRYGLESVAFGA